MCPASLPSVYKLWMVTKCRQVGAQGGSGGLRIRLFQTGRDLSLSVNLLFSACLQSQGNCGSQTSIQVPCQPQSPLPHLYTTFFFFCHKGALVDPGKDNIQKGAYSCQLTCAGGLEQVIKRKSVLSLIRLSLLKPG